MGELCSDETLGRARAVIGIRAKGLGYEEVRVVCEELGWEDNLDERGLHNLLDLQVVALAAALSAYVEAFYAV